MPLRVTLREALAAADRPLFGMWLNSASPLVAEICAGSGLDWVLIDAEHGPNDVPTVLAQLQAVAAYPVTALVRLPVGDTALIKQFLDLGAQNLLIPMVDTAEQAAELVRAVRYPPRGVRGVGSSLARAARWNRVDGYLADADAHVSLTVQIESATAVANVEQIVAVDGVDGIFVGPADLAASMGLLGRQGHPDVVAAVERCLAAARAAGKGAGVNAFVPEAVEGYVAAGAGLVCVGADVSLLARGSEALAARFIGDGGPERAGY
ncbi:MAG TPA: HpcH/HpaI aldolase/citrate lyase family protein [Pseudolysinimonas sp.]|nr:HpcH/HpaI aldolase/citrate lyase family protein [Pseudolysinimonas sp.]